MSRLCYNSGALFLTAECEENRVEGKRGDKMSKKFQVVLPDWLAEYIEKTAEIYEINLSAVIRMQICIEIITAVSKYYPGYKPGIDLHALYKDGIKHSPDNSEREQMFKNFSKIYFEARKAVEYRMKKEKEKK
jgi:hypothetical protein